MLNRLSEVERLLKEVDIGKATSFDLPITVTRDGKKYTLDLTEGDGNRMLTAIEVND